MKGVTYFAATSIVMAITCCNGCRKAPVIYPERKDIIEAVYASGKINPENEYKLSSLTNGTIIQKLVRDGDTVRKGQVLYVISSDAAQERLDAAVKNFNITTTNLSDHSPLLNDLKLSVANAEVKVRNDSLNYYRWKNLWEQNIGTKSNLDNAYSSFQISLNQKKIAEQKYNSMWNDARVSQSNARSQLAAARKDLSAYQIASDRDGIVYQTFKEAGETVYNNEVVALIGDHKERIIRLAVDQQDIDKVRTGQRVLLQADITGDTIYEAVVTAIYPAMNETDQTFRVDARFKILPEQHFIHGSIEANIIVNKKSNALVLPRSVLAGKDSVWTQVKGRKKKTGIEIGILTLEYAEVLSGLDEKTPVLPSAQK